MIGQSETPELADRYVKTFDKRLASDWEQGALLVSYETAAGWRGITKTVLTEVVGAGHDAKISGLPPAAVGVLKLMCPHLVSVG